MRAPVYAAMALVLLALAACGTRPEPVPSSRPAANDAPWFSDAATTAGLTFTHVNGMSGGHYMTEILGAGVALFDYDNDGDLDVFVVQSRGQGKLFRNELIERGSLSFTDVTAQSGIVTSGYGMGVATGDFDNDGFVDLYVTSFGANQLFHNNGNGMFTDVSKRSGTGISGWSVSATFVDYDRDGWADLFVGNYLRYRVEDNTPCFSPAGTVDYCTPNTYRPLPSRLFHNNRDGTFTDVTAKSGLGSEFGPALGVTAADFNGDGWPDLYVANDSQPNQLWINQHDGTFRNTALAAGVALTAEGKAEASMGVDAGDADNDGDEDLFVTEQTGEGHNFYVNDGKGAFEDHSTRSGLAAASLGYTGFGTAWFDYDNDGWLDVLTVNGAVLNPVSVKVTVYVPGSSSVMRYCPVPSVTAVRTFSMRTGLAASTVTPGSTAPDASFTTPEIEAPLWAEAVPEISSASTLAPRTLIQPRMNPSLGESGLLVGTHYIHTVVA